MNAKIKIIIADDHPLFLKGIKYVLEEQSNIVILGEASDGEEALFLIKKFMPDVALVDYEMPKCNGLCIAEEIKKVNLPVKLIILTSHLDSDIFKSAIVYGVKGYLLKESLDLDLIKAIETVYEGGHYINPILAGKLVNRCEDDDLMIKNHLFKMKLTAAEQNILMLIAANKSTHLIAEELFISERTVERHRSNICKKLNITGNNALLKYAFQNKELILMK